MKTVNKIILISCAFCYFWGMYIIASKLGITQHFAKAGLNGTWPSTLPSKELCIAGLIAYTALFGVVTYFIARTNRRHGQQQDKIQQQASNLHNEVESLLPLISRYTRACRQKGVSSAATLQRLQLLQRKMSALPASVLDDEGAQVKLRRIIGQVESGVGDIEQSTDANAAHHAFVNDIEGLIDQLKIIQSGNVCRNN